MVSFIKWQPEPSDVVWLERVLGLVKDGGIWAVPMTGQIFEISHTLKTLTLLDGPSSPDCEELYERTKTIAERLGYKTKKLESKT